MAEQKPNITLELDYDSATRLEDALRVVSATVTSTASSMIQAGVYPASASILADVNVITNFCQALKEQREKANAK